MKVWVRRREDVGGLHLAVRELPSDGPPLLLLHGLGVSGAVWQGFGRLLSADFRLLAPDLRGHGDSDKPSAGYLIRDYVGDIAALLGHEAGGPFVVLGHSLGAVIATQLAAERPSLVRALVLLDPPFDRTRPRDHIETVERLRHAAPGELERYLKVREPGRGDRYTRAMADLYRRAADGAFLAALRTEAGYSAVAAMASTIQAPTLVVAADPTLDAALGEAAAKALVATLPNAQLLTVPGARHAIHASHPRELAEVVRRLVLGA